TWCPTPPSTSSSDWCRTRAMSASPAPRICLPATTTTVLPPPCWTTWANWTVRGTPAVAPRPPIQRPSTELYHEHCRANPGLPADQRVRRLPPHAPDSLGRAAGHRPGRLLVAGRAPDHHPGDGEHHRGNRRAAAAAVHPQAADRGPAAERVPQDPAAAVADRAHRPGDRLGRLRGRAV